MSDVLGIAAFIFFQLAFAYVFFYLVCYRYIFRPLLHSMGWKGKAPEPTHALQGTGKYSFQIVGESFYQPAIAAIASQANAGCWLYVTRPAIPNGCQPVHIGYGCKIEPVGI